MKVVCAKNLLVESINTVSRAVTGRANQPILECCLLTAIDDGFKLMANDMEMAIETKNIDAQVLENGTVALDSRVFFDIVRRLPSDSVEIHVDEKNLTIIKAGKSEFKILGMNGEEFPALPDVEKDNAYSLPSAELKDMIRQTIFSVSQDISKPVLCGELLEIDANGAKLISVDGFRISLRSFGFENSSREIKVVIPGKTLSEIAKILPTEADSMTTFYITDKHILFDLENCVVVSRLLDGEFIKYENMFTKETETLVNVDRRDLLDCIERASLISRDSKKNPVKLKIAEGRIVVTSNTEMGASYEEIGVEQDGADLEIGFNPRYLTDVLKVLDYERISMEFITPITPCVIKVEGSDDYKYLVLPLRLRN
ncbi:MAG: DNA polymerase III subunit beta [Defluviitaleaceae bacterium]|nr:DNA polymerase III subunit beta [Defluviitaleaceae bacterium]